MKTENVLMGLGIVGGKGYGKVFKWESTSTNVDINQALDKLVEDLSEENNLLAQNIKLLVMDPIFRDRLQRLLDLDIEPDMAVKLAIKPLVDRWKKENPLFAKRGEEMERTIADALFYSSLNINEDEDIIFVAETITVPVAIKLKKSKVKGCVLKYLRRDSHAAIILSNSKIPTVSNVDINYIKDGEYLFVYGDLGIVSREELDWETSLETFKGSVFKTGGGEEVEILLNLDFVEDIYWVERFKTGVGLFRTEYLLMLGEDLGKLKEFGRYDEKFILRAFDIGGDKFGGERSPMRLLRDFKKEFDSMLSVVKEHRNFYIMIPMISFPYEAEAFYNYVRKWGIDRLGFMIETPMAVRNLEGIQRYAEFLSVGTNDLWSLYVGRSRGESDIKEQINKEFGEILYDILRKSKVPISVCGALASDEDGLRFLMDIGFRRFSVAPSFYNKAVSIVKDYP